MLWTDNETVFKFLNKCRHAPPKRISRSRKDHDLWTILRDEFVKATKAELVDNVLKLCSHLDKQYYPGDLDQWIDGNHYDQLGPHPGQNTTASQFLGLFWHRKRLDIRLQTTKDLQKIFVEVGKQAVAAQPAAIAGGQRRPNPT